MAAAPRAADAEAERSDSAPIHEARPTKRRPGATLPSRRPRASLAPPRPHASPLLLFRNL